MSSLGLHFISHPPPLVHHQNFSAQVMIMIFKRPYDYGGILVRRGWQNIFYLIVWFPFLYSVDTECGSICSLVQTLQWKCWPGWTSLHHSVLGPLVSSRTSCEVMPNQCCQMNAYYLVLPPAIPLVTTTCLSEPGWTGSFLGKHFPSPISPSHRFSLCASADLTSGCIPQRVIADALSIPSIPVSTAALGQTHWSLQLPTGLGMGVFSTFFLLLAMIF